MFDNKCTDQDSYKIFEVNGVLLHFTSAERGCTTQGCSQPLTGMHKGAALLNL